MRSIAASAKSILPKSVEVWLRSFKLKALSKKEVKTVFSDIYEKSLWGESKEKFCSGMGSSEVNSNEYVAWVNQFITDKKIRSVVDLGCGDFQVGRRLELGSASYTGCDVVPQLVAHNNETFGNENISFKVCNIIEDELPEADFCMIRQVFQHLSNDSIQSVLQKLKKYKYVLITDCQPNGDRQRINYDMPNFSGTRNVVHGTGLWLENAPFNVDGEVAFELTYVSEDDEFFRGFLISNVQ